MISLLFKPSQHSLGTTTYEIRKSNQARSLLTNCGEEVFGFEYYQDHKTKKFNIFSHPVVKINEPPTRPVILNPHQTNQSCYHFHFQEKSFLPFVFDSRYDFWNILKKEIKKYIKPKIKMFLQIILQKCSDDKWKQIAYSSYNHYLNGIKNPSTNKYILALQYKLLELFRLNYHPLDIEEAIAKIEQGGYRVAIRLIVEGDEGLRERIANKIKVLLNESRYTNAWTWTQAINKRKFIENAQMRLFPMKYYNQVLCLSELQFFFGGVKDLHNDFNKKQISSLESKSNTPVYDNIVIDDEARNTINELTLAMKKLQILKEDKLKIVDVRNSLTLNIISFERPHDVTIDKLRRRIEDFEIEMHTNGISFDQGAKKGSIAFMYPRKDRQLITLEEMMKTKEFKKIRQKYHLPIVLGVDVFGNPLYYDLSELVHILIAGATGSGKSVYLNVLLLSLTMNLSPNHLHLYLIDPKKVELSDYKNIPHLKHIADANSAFDILNHVVEIMEDRYSEMEKLGVKNIIEYNKKFPSQKWAYKVIVIDEYADLMLIDNAVEDFVQRLGQMARAAGIHLILATQRPSVNVVTGVIKANMVTRIGFTCKSHHDYKTIFDYMIPYRLVGKGDGVISWHGNDTQFLRFQSPINTDEKIFDKIIQKWGKRKIENLEKNISTSKQINLTDLKLQKLKKVILETKETRNRQLYELLNKELTPNEISNYLQQLAEENWVKKIGRKYEIILSEEELNKYLSEMNEG